MADEGPSAQEILRAQLHALSRRAQTLRDPDVRAAVEQEIRDRLADVARLRPDRPLPAEWLYRTLIGPPDDPEAYLVVRWFELGGDRAEPGELISPTRGFWRGRQPPLALIATGALVLLDRPEMAWACPCRPERFWISREAWLSHGCSEPPADDADPELPRATAANFATVYPEAYRRLKKDLDREPKRGEVAKLLSISVPTLYRYRIAAGLKWPPE